MNRTEYIELLKTKIIDEKLNGKRFDVIRELQKELDMVLESKEKSDFFKSLTQEKMKRSKIDLTEAAIEVTSLKIPITKERKSKKGNTIKEDISIIAENGGVIQFNGKVNSLLKLSTTVVAQSKDH